MLNSVFVKKNQIAVKTLRMASEVCGQRENGKTDRAVASLACDTRGSIPALTILLFSRV